MPELFHKSFSVDLSEFSATGVSNATVAHSPSAGLNGTVGGALFTRTGVNPSASGYVQHTFSGNAAMRMAWFNDTSQVSLGGDGAFVTLWNLRNVSDGNTLARLRIGQVSAAPRFYFDTFPDAGGSTSQDIAFTLKPAWIEVEIIRESFDGGNDGEMRFYFGGGDYPAVGQKVAEFLTVQNFIAYNATTQSRMGMVFGTTTVTGTIKLDEIRARNDNSPILVGLWGSPSVGTIMRRRRRVV